MSAQSEAALFRANSIRLGRAEVGREMCRGELSLEDAMDCDVVQGEAVVILLGRQPRWGVSRSRRAVADAGVSEFVCVRDLTERQRAAVLFLARGGRRRALPDHLSATFIVGELRRR